MLEIAQQPKEHVRRHPTVADTGTEGQGREAGGARVHDGREELEGVITRYREHVRVITLLVPVPPSSASGTAIYFRVQ